MAYREVAMWEILEVLRRVGRGESHAAVARTTGHSRKTVGCYVATAAELGWTPGAVEPSEDLAAAVYARHRPVGVRDPGEAEERLLPHRERIRAWLSPAEGEKRGLRLTKVHQLLGRRGVQVPYNSLHRFVVKHCGFRDRRRFTVRRADCEPGELAEVDFGRLGLIPDPSSGRRRVAWALIVTLGYSRHQYVHVTHSQKIPDLIRGIEDAWIFFGGVAERVVLDNLKAAVTKADRYDPVFGRTFDEYAAYRGFVIDAAPPRMPTGKPVVERQVPYVRDSFFRGEIWHDLAHLREHATRWCLHTAGTRIHGTTRKRPLAVFEALEQAEFLTLSRERFDPPEWAERKVHPDHHVSFGKAVYSVPTRYIGHPVWLRADSALVRLYVDGALIKTHPRQAPGGRSTDYDDYPPELTAYTLRDPHRLIRQASILGPHIGRFAEALLSGTFPKRLKLSGLVPLLPDRASYAQKTGLTPLDFLELVLSDEIERRDHKNLATRLDRAGFSEAVTLEDFDWDAPVTFDRDRVRDLFGLVFLERHQDVLFLGPVGVGKTFLASALGHAACRAGHRVLGVGCTSRQDCPAKPRHLASRLRQAANRETRRAFGALGPNGAKCRERWSPRRLVPTHTHSSGGSPRGRGVPQRSCTGQPPRRLSGVQVASRRTRYCAGLRSECSAEVLPALHSRPHTPARRSPVGTGRACSGPSGLAAFERVACHRFREYSRRPARRSGHSPPARPCENRSSRPRSRSDRPGRE